MTLPHYKSLSGVLLLTFAYVKRSFTACELVPPISLVYVSVVKLLYRNERSVFKGFNHFCHTLTSFPVHLTFTDKAHYLLVAHIGITLFVLLVERVLRCAVGTVYGVAVILQSAV